MKAFVLEATIIDHPEYECFVGVFATMDGAIESATTKLRAEECDIIITRSGDTRCVVTTDDGLSRYFIHQVEIGK